MTRGDVGGELLLKEEEKGKKRVGVSGSCLGQPGAGEDQEQEHRQHVTARGRQLTLVQVCPMQGHVKLEFPSINAFNFSSPG